MNNREIWDPKKIKAVVALGNPGEKYENTYHNAGKIVLEEFLEMIDEKNKIKFKNYGNFDYAKVSDSLTAIISATFMNESGMAVAAILNFFNLKPEEILIIHDDSDIKLGNYKINFNRNTAGHRGLNSIVKTIRTKEFWRFRVGIRKETNDQYRIPAKELVLQNIKNEDRAELQRIGGLLKEKLIVNETPVEV